MIYSNVPVAELETLRKLKVAGAVNIKERVSNANNLCSHLIIEENIENKYCLYIGHQKDLRRRIKEHFNGSRGTGCLSIFKYNKLKKFKWEVYFYDFKKMNGLVDCNLTRTIFENKIRSKFGWPILCAK